MAAIVALPPHLLDQHLARLDESNHPQFNDVVTDLANPATHELYRNLIKTAGIIMCVASAAIAVTAFVLASIYAPAFIPSALIFGGVLTSAAIWVVKTHFKDWRNQQKADQEADADVAQKLQQWTGRTYDQIIEVEAATLHDMGIDDRNIFLNRSQGADDELMKTMLARLFYYWEKSEAAQRKIEKYEAELRQVRERAERAQVAIQRASTPETRFEFVDSSEEVWRAIMRRNKAIQDASAYDIVIATFLIYMIDPTFPVSAGDLAKPLRDRNTPHPAFYLEDPARFRDLPCFLLPNGRTITYQQATERFPVDIANRIYAAAHTLPPLNGTVPA